MPLDPQAFRRTLGAFTTGVTIITTRDGEGRPVGLTANSFNSVSLEPPMVLWSLAKSSRNLSAFAASEHWAVHILSIEQESLSNRFAQAGADKFAGVPTETGVGGTPLLSGCSALLQCRTSFRYEGGDHMIFVGEVLACERSSAAPLVFHGGRYAMAAPKPAGTSGFGEDFLGFVLSRAHFELYARVRAVHQAHGLDDAAFFVLASLLARPGLGLAEVDRCFTLTGQPVGSDTIPTLAGRGLLEAQADEAGMRLSAEGRELALRLLAQIKSIESELLGKLGVWEAVSLKSLLKQFVQVAGEGLPDLWAA